jgi:hypothetical protein
VGAPAGADGRELAGEEQCADAQGTARVERERSRLPGVRPRPQTMEGESRSTAQVSVCRHRQM